MNRGKQLEDHIFLTHKSSSSLGYLETNSDSYPDKITWYRNFERTVLSGEDQVSVYTLSDSDSSEIKIVLPCVVQRSGSGLSGGVVVQSMSNYYTPLHAPLYIGEREPELAGELLHQIIKKENPSKIVLFPLDTSSQEFAHYKAILSRNYWFFGCKVCFYNWFENSNSGFDDYFSQRSSKIRNTYRRRKRKFDSIEGSKIKIVSGDALLENYIADFNLVYGKSWKSPEPYVDFIPELMRLCAQTGELRLGLAYLYETPVAAQFWIVSGRTAHIYKLSYDKKFASLSPGTLLMVELMKYVIDVDKVSKVDFLSGDDNYKKDWMSNRQERVVLTGFNPRSFSGLLGIGKELLHASADKLKGFLNQRNRDKNAVY